MGTSVMFGNLKLGTLIEEKNGFFWFCSPFEKKLSSTTEFESKDSFLKELEKHMPPGTINHIRFCD